MPDLTFYQQIFDQRYAALQAEDADNRYGHLVYSLQAVFEAAGINDITGQELAGAQHNHIVGSIGETDLARIARSFIGWIRCDDRLNYPASSVAEGYTPLGLSHLYGAPYIDVHTLSAWQDNVKARLKELGIRQRNSKRYQEFIAQSASKVAGPFRQAAQVALEERQARLKQMREEMEADHDKARGMAGHYRRTAYIVEAFCRVAGVADERGVGAKLIALAERIERGIASRLGQVDRYMGREISPDEVVTQSVERYPDLKALWEAALAAEKVSETAAITAGKAEEQQ